MAATFGLGILGAFPVDLSRADQEQIINTLIRFNPTYSFYEKLPDGFYRCTFKNGSPVLEKASGKKAQDLATIWSHGYGGSLSYNLWSMLDSPQFIIGKFKRKTDRVELPGREGRIVNAEQFLTSVRLLKEELTHANGPDLSHDLSQLNALRDTVSKAHWNQVIVSISE